MITLMVVVILSVAFLNKIKVERDNLQRQADKAFLSSLDLALSGLNIDYTKVDGQDKTYFYSRIIANLGAAKELVPFTSYKHNKNLSYTLENLSQFLINNYSSGFTFDLEKQIDIYNYLLEINLNPTDKNTVNKLNEFFNSME